jgi:hypothetical protein
MENKKIKTLVFVFFPSLIGLVIRFGGYFVEEGAAAK